MHNRTRNFRQFSATTFGSLALLAFLGGAYAQAPYSWGWNSSGQLGNNSTVQQNLPVPVFATGVLAGKTVTAMAAGENHSLALCSDGTVAAWGMNIYGQLGNNTTTASLVPALVNTAGVLATNRVVAIAAGQLHSLALCTNGMVVAWGYNFSGELGNNSSSPSPVPVLVNTAGVLSNKTVVAIAAGYSHNLALCSDGTVVAWGDNASGALGNNSTLGSSVPVLVSTAGVLSNKTVVAVAAGHYHSLALCSDGTVVAWGSGSSGQLGNNTTTPSLVPVPVNTTSGLSVLYGNSVAAIAAGDSHSFALCSNGTLAAWGQANYGQLGNNTTANSSVPVAVLMTGPLANHTVAAIAAGAGNNLALCSDGTLVAWGRNSEGQLGNNTTANSFVPVAVSTSTLPAGARFTGVFSGSSAFNTLALVNSTSLALTCATNKTVNCGTTWTFDPPTFSDNCTGTNLTLTILTTVTNGLCPMVITRTWQVTDACTNSATCSQTVTVVDTTPPVLTCATNKTVQCGTAWTFDAPTAYDTCGGNAAGPAQATLTVLSTVTNGICPQVLTRTWLATDLCGNTNTCSQTVTVNPAGPCVACATWIARETNRIWYAVASSDNGVNLVAVALNGLIYTSPDSGLTWTDNSASSGTYSWSSVASSSSGQYLVAGTFNGQIYTSANYGVSWTARAANAGTLSWRSVASDATGQYLLAVADNSQIWTSPNFGVTWTAHGPSNLHWHAVASDSTGQYLIAVGYGFPVYTSTDFGVNWTAQNGSGSRNWQSVASSANGSKLVAGVYLGLIYTSIDSGVTWTAQTSSGNRSWDSIASSSDGNKLVAVSFSDQIYCSTDSGTNWAAHESSRQWSGVASSADASKMVAVVYGGGQIYTSGCTPAVGLSCATNKTVNCGTAWTFDPPAASDTCSGTNVTLTILSTVTNDVCPRIITRTWMATDACTNSSTCSQTVTVVDTTPPVLTCATNKTVQCGTAWSFDAPSASDACSGTNVTLAVLGTVTNGSCPQVLTRTWSATDPCGNSNTCSQTVTVVNTNLPVLVCPKNIVVASCTVTQVFYTVIAADACNSNLAVVCTPPSGSGFSPGTTTTVLCVASNCAGSASCSFTISIQCAANPCIPAPANMVLWLPFDETSGTNSVNLVPGGNNGLRVNGPVVTSGFVANSLSFDGLSQYVRVPSYNAINFGTNDFSIDAWIRRAAADTGTSARIIVDKRDQSGGVYTGFAFYLIGSLGTLGFDLADGANYNGGTYTRYTSSFAVPNDQQWHHVAMTVARGLTNGLLFYLDGVADSVPRNPTVRPGSVSTASPLCVGSQSSSVGFLFPGSIDEVELFSRALAPTELAALFNAGSAGKCKCVPAPANMVLWLPFDETSGTNSANLVPGGSNGIQVNGPVVTSGFVAHSLSFDGLSRYVDVPSYSAINFGTNDFSIDAWVRRAAADTGTSARIIVDKRDQFGGVYTGFAFYLIGSQGTLGFDLADGANYNGGTYTRYTSGFAVPNDQQWHHVAITVARHNTNGLLFYLDGVADSVPGNPVVRPGSVSTASPLRVGSQSSSLGYLFSGSIDEVELFSRALAPTELAALFNAGSAGKCKEPCATPLLINCATNKMVPCDSDWKFDLPTATSCCSTNVAILSTGIVTNGVCPRLITQTWMITDGCGNSNTCSQTVTVVDTTPPLLTCATNKTVNCGTTWTFDAPTASDSCSGTNVTLTILSTVTNGLCPMVITRTWQATDACTNSATCSQVVTVMDTTPPVLTCATNKTVQCGAAWTFDAPTVLDACSGTNVTITILSTVTKGTCPQDITRTWLATDPCGNSNTCSQTVTVVDTTPPVLTCATNKTVQCGTAWSFDAPSASDACSGTNVTLAVLGTVTNGSCPQVLTRTWSATDPCGNSNTCSQRVTVVDPNPPVIFCQTNVVTVPLNTNCQLVIPLVRASATDNCTPRGYLRFTQSPTNGTIVSAHSQIVTVTVTDLCGNSNHCSVLVVGVARLGSVVTCPTNWIVTNCLVPCVLGSVTVTNCSCTQRPSLSQSPACNTPLGPGINSVTVTVIDCNGIRITKVIHLVITGSESFLPSLYNTAVDSARALLPIGWVDPHYTLGPVPLATPSYTAPHAIVSSPIWLLPPIRGLSDWIAPSTNSSSDPSGFYTYTNQFTLPVGADPASASISGRWSADNGAKMYINGVAAPVPPIATPNGYQTWHNFTLATGFLGNPAVNTLRFVVTNLTGRASYTGLRVEYTHALVNCYTCAPPSTVSITPGQSLQEFSSGILHVTAAGTPPLSYQWYLNGALLTNNGHDSGVATSTLGINPVLFSDAGNYTVVISNPCGAVTNHVSLAVTLPWWWPWGWWNVAQLDNPLAATAGPDLNLVGTSDYGTNFTITAGTTEDFGLPELGGQIVNVMHVAPLPMDTSIQVPLIAPPGSNSVNSYTVIMDLYQPGTSSGTPSTLFASVPGQGGVSLTLDAQNNLHLTGSAGGVPFDAASAAPLPVDAWNRLALVVDDPQDGIGVNLSLYLNGQSVADIAFGPVDANGIAISWLNSNSIPTLLSRPGDASGLNGEFYLSSIQFHAIALGPDMIAGIGSPDTGPAPANATSVGPQPVLSAMVSGGRVSFSWTGSPYTLQETTDLTSGVWVDSALPFTESQVNGDIHTTAIADPAVEGLQKFYRLLFRP